MDTLLPEAVWGLIAAFAGAAAAQPEHHFLRREWAPFLLLQGVKGGKHIISHSRKEKNAKISWFLSKGSEVTVRSGFLKYTLNIIVNMFSNTASLALKMARNKLLPGDFGLQLLELQLEEVAYSPQGHIEIVLIFNLKTQTEVYGIHL